MSLIIGLGEIGGPLEVLMRENGVTPFTIDIQAMPQNPPTVGDKVEYMHICIPETTRFREVVVDYAKQWKPQYVIIHSSVTPGTSEQIQYEVDYFGLAYDTRVYYSPVRGNMRDGMRQGLLEYTKFMGAVRYEPDDEAERALSQTMLDYMNSIGFKTFIWEGATALEWAKSLDLLLYALDLVGAQIIERFIAQAARGTITSEGRHVDDAAEFSDYYHPVAEFIKSTPTESDGKVQRILYHGGHIGGHCVVQAVERLLPMAKDDATKMILNGILRSNILRFNELLNEKPSHHP